MPELCEARALFRSWRHRLAESCPRFFKTLLLGLAVGWLASFSCDPARAYERVMQICERLCGTFPYFPPPAPLSLPQADDLSATCVPDPSSRTAIFRRDARAVFEWDPVRQAWILATFLKDDPYPACYAHRLLAVFFPWSHASP